MNNDWDRHVVPPSGIRLAVLGVCLIVFLPILFYGFPGERDRWKAAAIMEQYLDGDRQAAMVRLQEIVSRHPGDQQLRVTLARWMLNENQPRAALELIEAVPREARSRALLVVYQDCLQANGRTAEALQLFRELHPANLAHDRSAMLQHLNALSYLQALGRQDLRLARKNSNQVVAEIAGQWNARYQDNLSVANQIALSAALVYRGSTSVPEPGQEIRTGQFRQEILRILDAAVRRAESEYANVRLFANPLALELTRRIFGGAEPAEVGAAEDSGNYLVQPAAQALATLLTARALVWQDLGDLQRSFADRQRVIQLGRDPEVVAQSWPALSVCVNQLANLAMTLDTRGCVLYQLEILQLALGDLNSAITAQECLVATSAWQMPGVLIETADLRERREQVELQPRKTLAVLLFHRSWILRAMGLEPEAIADLARVRQMGYVPGDALF